MEIRVYDAEFNLRKIIENHTSLLWRRRYNDSGEFSLTCPATMTNIEALQMGRIVWFRGKLEAGVIENRTMTQNQTQNSLVVSGRFLDSYMDRRLIRPTYNFSGTVENAMRNILTNAVAIPMVQLEDAHGWTDTVEFQASYKNLLEYEQKLAKYAAYGFRFRPNFVDKTITFEIYQGLDHSIEQHERGRVIFSEEYANMTATDYSENDKLYKTVAYIGGEGDSWQDKEIIISGDDSLTGLDRREVYSDASDLTSEGLTIAQYRATLAQRGADILNGCVLAKSFSCNTNPSGSFIYETHYDVGDIVTIRKESWGISENQRITEIQEVYERGKATITPTFGTTLPESINWED